MLKDLFFFILRGALGFILITAMTMMATSLSYIPPENFDSMDDPFIVLFFRGQLIVWFAALFVACLSFTGLLKSFVPAGLLRVIDWSPAFAPVLYGACVYLWFSLTAA